MPSDVDIAVVVVTYESAGVIEGLMTSLPHAMRGIDWELFVVDNASSDRTLATVEEHPLAARVVQMGRNAGYAAGINAGMAAAGPRTAYLLLNPDVRLEPGSVALLHAALRDPGVGIAVPRLVDAHGGRIDSLRREPSVRRALAGAVLGVERAGRLASWGEVVTDDSRYVTPGPADWAEGSTQLVSAACVRRVGLWDESFFLYSEETDYHLRARDLGLGVGFVPAAGAQHLEGGSATSPTLWPLLVANRLLLHRKRHGRPAAAAFWLALVLQEASRALVGRQPSRAALKALLSPGRLRRSRDPEWLVRP